MSDPAPSTQILASSSLELVQPLDALNDQLSLDHIEAEFYFVGGAVICQAFNPTPSTAHIAELFRPTYLVGQAAERVRERGALQEGWLNDAVRRYLQRPGAANPYLELSHLSAFVPLPGYVLAVKCAAMRLGEDFREHDDVRYMLRALNLTNVDEALEVVGRYFGERQLSPETSSILEGLLGS